LSLAKLKLWLEVIVGARLLVAAVVGLVTVTNTANHYYHQEQIDMDAVERKAMQRVVAEAMKNNCEE